MYRLPRCPFLSHFEFGFRGELVKCFHDMQMRFLGSTDPKQPIVIIQFWPADVALERGELPTQSRALQGNLFLTAEDEKIKTNPNRDAVQHRDTSLRPSSEESTR